MKHYLLSVGVAISGLMAVGVAAVSCGRLEDSGAEEVAAEQTTTSALELQHCRRYDNVTAAIGAAVIDCQGTIGPDSFTVVDGLLVPKFSSCRESSGKFAVNPDAVSGKATDAQTTFETLRTLLSIQSTPGDPNIKECFAGRWNRWSELFPR